MLAMKFIGLLATAMAVKTTETVGPIQKVITLLDELQSKIMKEGDAGQIAYEEFVDWCSKQAIQTKHAIDDSAETIEGLQALIDSAQAYIEQLSTEIGGEGAVEPGLTGKISKLEKELGAATDIRTKEKADFDALDKDLAETVDMLGRAEKVLAEHLGSGGGAGLIQFAQTFQSIVDASMVNIQDKKLIQSMLQKATSASGDEDLLQQPQATTANIESSSSPILKTMADLREKAEASRAAAQKEEMNAAHAFAMFEQSSKQELNALQSQLDTAKKRLALNNEKKATASGKMETANKEKAASETYLADTQQECMEKASDFETASAERTEEVKTLMTAKKILLNQGKPVLAQTPPSFLQVQAKVSSKVALPDTKAAYTRQLAAANYLRSFDSDSWVLMQVSDKILADPFGKVKDMLYGMIDKLEKEQAAEAEHKAWCDEEMKKTTAQEGKKKARLNEVQIRSEKTDADITKLTEDVAVLVQDLQNLDEATQDATKLRAKAATEWEEESAEYKAGQEACAAAIKVLKSYYSGKKGFLQTGASTGGPDGIIGLLEVAESDFAKSLAEGQAAEDALISEYEKFTEDAKVSRATMVQDQKNKNAEKSRLDALMAELGEDVEDSQKDLNAVLEYLDKVKTSCETKTPSHEERQARRAKEIEGLKTALGILAGEDLGFIQKSALRR
jgi:DNA repair exonuclease SbcCD ATPase subunit